MKYIRELIEALILAALIGGPLFYYFLYVMKP
jgi:hypothetical protein